MDVGGPGLVHERPGVPRSDGHVVLPERGTEQAVPAARLRHQPLLAGFNVDEVFPFLARFGVLSKPIRARSG